MLCAYRVLRITYYDYLRGCAGALNDAEDLVFTHDEEFFAVELDLGAAVFAEKNAVAGFDVERLAGAVFFILAFAGGDDFAFLRFFLGSVGDEKPAAVWSPSSIRRMITRSCNGVMFVAI